MNNLNEIAHLFKQGKQIHDIINERKEHTKIFGTGPDHKTNFFLKDGL